MLCQCVPAHDDEPEGRVMLFEFGMAEPEFPADRDGPYAFRRTSVFERLRLGPGR